MNMCTYKMKEGYSTICSIYSDQNIKSERKCVCKAALMGNVSNYRKHCDIYKHGG